MLHRDTKNGSSGQRNSRASLAVLLLSACPLVAAAQDEALGLSVEERAEIGRMLRRGELRDVQDLVDEVLEEEPDEGWALFFRGRLRLERCEYETALSDLEHSLGRALAAPASSGSASGADPELAGAAARGLAEALVELGRPRDASEVLGRAGALIDPARDARDAWSAGSARLEAGERAKAREAFQAGADAPGPETWEGRLARGRCERALGFFERAARSLVEADRLASEGEGTEPDVLAELGNLYFEVYGEVDDAMTRAHLPSKQYREALSLNPEHEAARLGLFELYRFNWALSHESPDELLRQVLAARPDSIGGLLASTSADLDDGRLLFARRSLERLSELAPRLRAVRAERAALAWIEHDRDGAQALLAELAAEDPLDSKPERLVATHLNEIYRFAEALPFAEAAAGRDGKDWRAWTEFARALSGVGREKEALDAFGKAEEAAEGRQNAWRTNTARVLALIQREYVEEKAGDHTFVWSPDAAAVLSTYLVPFYARHREGLAERYGHTPGPVRIETFRTWDDFSVRSTGFTGFSALGVCFGPVVTAVSPLSELRGTFSWARTAYHEYTHVIHLSLSHNRCPRWITEGLATWEEEQANPAWSRNMRVELLNAYANEDLIPVRDLNRAFRTPRILFAYYEGGLLCSMLIDDVGFSPMIRLLSAFDRGLDLDDAFKEVLGTTPEEVDRRFRDFVGERVRPLKLEPLWSPQRVLKLRLTLAPEPPAEAEARAAWVDDWLTVGWGSLQSGKRVDAEEALRRVRAAGAEPARYHFLRGELSLVRSDERDEARAALKQGIEAGGEDFHARLALAALAQVEGEVDEAEEHLLAAERDFPGIQEPFSPAELKLAELYALRGDRDSAMEARRRWLAFNAGDVEVRLQVAEWLDEKGRYADSEVLYREANEVDPFRRALHKRWGMALSALGRHEDALREFGVALLVPGALDPALGPKPEEVGDAAWQEAEKRFDADRPEILARRAGALLALGRKDEARAAAEEALALDPEQELARGVLDGL